MSRLLLQEVSASKAHCEGTFLARHGEEVVYKYGANGRRRGLQVGSNGDVAF
jgi:hypothetical protein